MASVGIIDYGSGNFISVFNAFKRLGADAVRVTKPEELLKNSHIVLPGVGSYRNAINRLVALEIAEPLKEILIAQERVFLGICVGMQILGRKGSEFGDSDGLNIFDGYVEKLSDQGSTHKIILPHIGWNSVEYQENSKLFSDFNEPNPDFYFLHSYHLNIRSISVMKSTTNYGQEFNSSIEFGNVFGVQFHPEKSQTNGNNLFLNFLRKK